MSKFKVSHCGTFLLHAFKKAIHCDDTINSAQYEAKIAVELNFRFLLA